MRSYIMYLTVVSFTVVSAVAQQNSTSAPVTVVPQLISFSATANVPDGKPLTGLIGITFALYKDQEGGAPLWLETQNVQLDSHGHYTVQLGQVNTLPAELFASGEARWLGVQVEGQLEQARTLLLAVPYALKALDAETVGGKPAAAFALAATASQHSAGKEAPNTPSAPPAIFGAGATGYIAEWLSAAQLGNSALFQSSAGNLGISTTTPAQKFEIDLGNALVKGTNNFQKAGDAAYLYVGDANHAIEAAYGSGLVLGAYKVPQAVFIQDKTGYVGVGTTTPTAILDVSGTGNFLGVVTNGNVTATGVVTGSSYQIGSNLFAFGSYTNQNAFSGFAGNAGIVGQYNTGFGYQALYSNIGDIWGDGSYNTAVGVQALYTNNDTSGQFSNARSNTAIGYQALEANTTGSGNTATGTAALAMNTTADNNTAVGASALYSNNTGFNNTAIGGGALLANTQGFGDTAVGDNALGYNTQGSFNTAVGEAALGLNNTGNYNTALGYSANPAGSLSNATAIGAYAYVTQSNTLVLGSIANTNGCTPSINCTTVSVGIGTSAPDNLLTVNGTADKPGGGSWGTYSDRRLKTVDGSFNSGLSQILKLHPVRYRYNKENALGIRDEQEHIGLVAQDVEKVIPEAVTENSKGYLLLNNDPILWTMLNAIKEQQAQIHKQEELIKTQRAEMKAQQAEIARLGSQVRAIQGSLNISGQMGEAVHAAKAQQLTMRQ